LTIKFTPEARRDLSAIHRYIVEDSPQAADRLVLRLHQSIAHLERFPELGRPWTVPPYRVLSVPSMPYRVIYQVTDAHVEITTIVHTRRKTPPIE